MKMNDTNLKEFRKVALEWSSNSGNEFIDSRLRRNQKFDYNPSWTFYWRYLKAGVKTAFVPRIGIKCISSVNSIPVPLETGLNYYPEFLDGGTRVLIDYMMTYITEIRGDFAKGFIVRTNIDFMPECWICRKKIPGSDIYLYAHGETIRDAFRSLAEKFDMRSPLEERIRRFKDVFPDLDVKYKASDLYYWHGIITGSYIFGRNDFCEKNGIDVSKDEFTLREFFDLVLKDYNYGNDSIKKLKELYR